MNDFWNTAISTDDAVDPRTEAGVEALSNVRRINWDSLSHEGLNALGRSVNLLSDDPGHTWKIFRFYTRMLREGFIYEAVGLLREGNVRLRLRESWLAVNCTDIDEPEVYRTIEGEDGYETYMEYATALKEEVERVPYYADVVAGKVPEGEHRETVEALFTEYIPGENW